MEFDSLRPRQRVSTCCKKFAAFLFSQVGLATMVVAYSIMGGFLFRAIEGPYEEDLKAEVKAYRELKVNDAWNTLTEQFGNVTVWNKTQFVEEMMRIFVDFQDNVAKAVKEKGWDGKDESGEQWSFPGALLYAVTVITTIGYGHIAPKTNLGRFVTILYALVGIPLTFLYLSTIGNFLAHCFRIFYKRICCDICCCLKCERMKRRQLQMLRRQRQIDQFLETQTSALETTTTVESSDKRLTASVDLTTANIIANNYITMPSGQTLTDGNGHDVSTQGGVTQGENWLNIAEPDSGKPRFPPTSAQALRLRTVSSGNCVRDERVLFSVSSSSCSSQGDSRGRKGKKTPKNRSRSVEQAIPVTPVTIKRSSTDTRQGRSTSKKVAASQSERSYSLESAPASWDKTGLAKDSAELKLGVTSSRLNSVLKRTTVGVKSDDLEGKTLRKRSRLWRSQSVKDVTRKRKPERLPRSVDDRGRRVEDGIAAAAEVKDTDAGKLNGGRELGGKKGRSTEDETDKVVNGLKDVMMNRPLISSSVVRSASLDSSLRKGLQESTLGGSVDSFVTATEDAPLYDDIYQSISVFDCTPSVRNLSTADSGLSSGSRTGGETTTPSRNRPGSQGQAYYQRLTKNSVRIRFAESELGPECHMEYDDDDDEDLKHSKIRVPIYVCLIVITSYILAGSVLFTLWEDWDLLTGSYFCFITLSTIGFGDIVPGTDMDKWDSSEKLVLCALWLALGLSLLAMCFNLMQEEVKEKCKWIACKLGLIRNETKL